MSALRCTSCALVVSLLACGSPMPAPSDAGADAASIDTGPMDVGVDAAPPPGPRWCGLCHADAECGGGLCLSLNGGAEHACGVPCVSDADCTNAGLDARCMLEAAGLPTQCRPTSGSCIVSAPGGACPPAGCVGSYDVCLSFDHAAPVCTARCNTDADCPTGMHRCVDRGGGNTFCAPDASYDQSLCAMPTSAGPPPICACSTESARAITSELLASVGLTPCDLHFTQAEIDGFGASVAHDRFRMGFTDRIRSYAPEVPRFGHEVAMALDAAATSNTPVTGVLIENATLADLVPLSPNVPSDATDLAGEVMALATAAGAMPDPTLLMSSLGSLPANLQATVAPIVRATARALAAREQALTGIDDPTRTEAYDLGSGVFLPVVGVTPSFDDVTAQGLLLGDVHVDLMAQAAIDLAATIETYDLTSFAGTTVSFAIDTPAGSIVFAGPSDDVHMNREILLLVDFGGNDTYRGSTGANASATNGVSVVIDVAGIDDYGYVAVPVASDTGPMGSHRLPSDGHGRAAPGAQNGPFSESIVSRQGAGRLGIGMLFDFGADGDHYQSLRMSQGYGALGVGVLYDDGGDDVYEGEAAVQGAGSFGIGVLYDRSGADQYTSYAFSQGFGYTRGIGTLYDVTGGDTYIADPTDVLYYSPQNPGGSNSSFAQGAGFGRRAPGPPTDDVNMSGGLGVLRDAAGDDAYTVGIFGQGTGYWFGTGLLLEGTGNDHYDGWWYVHGSAAHFAVGALLDDAGGDTYQCANPGDPARNTSIGVGHDFSLGWLVDRAGDDIVHAPNLSLGSGNAAGFGFFVDLAGDDTYTATSDFSFGDASIETPGDTLRAMPPGTIGLFVDRGGTDSYTRPTMAPIAENSMWTQEEHTMMGEHGAGADAAMGTVGLGLD